MARGLPLRDRLGWSAAREYIGGMSEIPLDKAAEVEAAERDAEAEAGARLDAEADVEAKLEPEAEGEL
jgi:hypothetical protein